MNADGFAGLWRTAQVDPSQAGRLAETLGVPLRVARWLLARGFEEESARSFLDPERVAFSSPYAFLDMPIAVERLHRAVVSREPVAVVGDYDVDGITATAITVLVLRSLGAQVSAILPNRERDGYGLTPALVERAAQHEATLIVTVDNGIRAAEAVACAVERGMDVIVTDHHEPGDVHPTSAMAIIHWSRAGDPGIRDLSGAGVAWKLGLALLDLYGGSGEDDATLRLYLTGLAALGAVADVMPMRGENRRLVHAGIHALRCAKHPGWLALCGRAGVDPARLTDEDLAWRLAPRLNAAGRMADPDIALRLLVAEDTGDAEELAARLETLNEMRRRETDEAVAMAEAMAESGDTRAGIVVAGPWRVGLAGIVAAKLVESSGCPAIVFADDGSEVLRGSGRAPAGFPLHEAVARCAHCLVEFGGHAGAVGVHVTRSRLEVFRQAFDEACGALRAEVPVMPETDDYLPLSAVTLEICRWAERFRPFGPDNPPLTFYIGPVRIREVHWLGYGQRHVRIRVEEDGHLADLVWFDAPSHVRSWSPGTVLSAAVTLSVNEWKNRMEPQLRVVTAHRMEGAVLKDMFATVYRLLRARRRLRASDVGGYAPHIRPHHAEMILESFVELGFACRTESAYDVNEQVNPCDLRESKRYQRHLWMTMRRTAKQASSGDRGASV